MWVSKEKCEKAREYDVLSYLQIADPGELVRVSRNEFCLRSHDSFRISNGKWHWWSRDKAGHTAIDYLVEVKGYTFPNAVNEVMRVMGGRLPKRSLEKRKSFILPEASETNDIMYEYLLGRGIDKWLIEMMEISELIYEDKKHHSVIFVGQDYDRKPRHAAYRSTKNVDLKGDISGSDKRFCFSLPYRKCEVLRVFEGPMDLLSYVTLCIKDGTEWQYDDMITVCGVYKTKEDGVYHMPAALDEYLKQNPKVKQIFIHFDNDDVGASAARRLIRELEGKYEAINMPPLLGKDYNEYLMITKNGGRDGRKNND